MVRASPTVNLDGFTTADTDIELKSKYLGGASYFAAPFLWALREAMAMRAHVLLPETRIIPDRDCVIRGVGEETLLLHLKNGTYYGLDLVGGHVWAMLENGATFGEITTSLADRFDVEPEQLETDIRAFLTDLADHELVRFETPVP